MPVASPFATWKLKTKFSNVSAQIMYIVSIQFVNLDTAQCYGFSPFHNKCHQIVNTPILFRTYSMDKLKIGEAEMVYRVLARCFPILYTTVF